MVLINGGADLGFPFGVDVIIARCGGRGIGAYLLDYLIGAVPPVATFEHPFAPCFQHRALGDAPTVL